MTPYLLNLFDLLLTLHALSNGGVELNPLMRNPAVMLAWKVVGVGVLCYSLGKIASDKREKASDMAKWGMRVCTVVYTVLLFYHFYFIFGGAFYV